MFSPASAYTNNAHGGAATEALNNLADATAADRQASANQAEVVANLAGANQQLAHQLQQAQQKIQKMMENIHLPGTSQARSYELRPKNLRQSQHIYLSYPHPRHSTKGTQAGSAETNRSAQRVPGTMQVNFSTANSMSQNGTPATHVPHPAAALITTSMPIEPISWEDWRNTERWSASDGAGVCYIH